MAAFPSALIPSTRTYSPGAFPHTAHRVYDGSEARVRHSNAVLGVRLRLFFPALTTADLLLVIAHYNGQRGRFLPFAIPDELLSGTTAPADFTPAGHQWRYAVKPAVEDVSVDGGTNLHNLTVELETVPPENTIAQGARLRVRASLQAGSPQLGIWLDAIASLAAGSATGGLSLLLNASASLSAGAASTGTTFVDPLTVVATLTAGAADNGGAPSDPDFASVSLLLPLTGTHGSTTFPDQSANAFTMSVFGDAQITTADPDFPDGAMVLDGTGDYITSPSDTDFVLGTGDYTIEFDYKPNAIDGNVGVFTFGDGNTDPGPAMSLQSSVLLYHVQRAGSPSVQGLAVNATKQHVAATRSGTNVRLFVEGNQIGSTLTDSTNQTKDFINIGWYFSSVFAFDGLIGRFRITKGVARYTANFTPPVGPFPTF